VLHRARNPHKFLMCMHRRAVLCTLMHAGILDRYRTPGDQRRQAVGFHILRHTAASLAVMNGTPLVVVARNLGHASTRMVEAHYGHLAPSYIADEIRKGAPQFGFEVADKKIVQIAGTVR
jgi:integrase